MARLMLALGVLLALLLVAWSWLSGGPPRPPAAPAPVTADADAVPAATPADGPTARAADRAAVAEPAPQPSARAAVPAVLEVTVRRRADGAPVEGVSVVVHGEDADDAPVEVAGTTDAAGRCRLSRETGFVVHSLSALPTATTTREELYPGSVWIAAGDLRSETLLISGGGTLVGRVVDPEGRPVPAARVLGWCSGSFDPQVPPDRSTTADEGGGFELGHLGGDFQVVAESAGLACSQGLRGELAPGARAEGRLELVLAPATHVRGRVLGARGEPLAARLKIDATSTRGGSDATDVAGIWCFRPVRVNADSDAQGVFELGPVPRHAWSVAIDHDEHLRWYGPMPTDGREWIVRLAAGCGLRGLVLDAAGAPVGDARVRVDPPDANGRSARTAQDGSFLLQGLECGPGALLHVTAQGHAPFVREGVALLDGPAGFLELRLEPGLPLAGRVVDTDGAPVRGAALVLVGPRTYQRRYTALAPETIEHLVGRGRARTDHEGRFRFEDLYAGRFVLRVHPPGEMEMHQDAVAFAGDEEVEIVLDRAALDRVVLEGRVVDVVTSQPVQAFTVTPMVWSESSATGRNIEVLATDGRFRVAGLDPGRIALSVEAAGYARWSDEPRELAQGVQRYEVRLAALRSVTLRLVRPDGSPFSARASVSVRDPAGAEVWVERGEVSSSVISLSDGEVAGVGLPARLLAVAFDLHDGEEPLSFDLDLERDPSDVFEFVVERVEREPFAVQALLYSVASGYDVSGLEQELAAHGAPVEREDCAPLAAPAEVVARNARGVALLRGTLEPVEGGLRTRWEWPGQGRSSDGTLPLPLVLADVPGRAVELVVTAEGHAPLRLPLDASAENGGLPPWIVLRRP